MIDGDWIELRAGDGKLFGRIHRETMDLQIVWRNRDLLFDLVATARDGSAVVQERTLAPQDKLPVSPKIGS